MTPAERDLAKAVRVHAARAAALDAATAERDQAIRAAIEAGIPYAEIARATGLSEQRLYQVRRGARI